MSTNDNSKKISHKSLNPEDWVDNYGDALYAYALRRVREPDLAEEMVQETFLAALHTRESFRGQSSEKTWLVGILKHKILDHFRKSSREWPLRYSASHENSVEDVFDQNGNWIDGPSKWPFDPSKSLEQKEFLKTFYQCLSKLPPRLAQVFILRELDGLGGKEICDLMSISPNNLWVMLYRARMHLRNQLELIWLDKTEKERKKSHGKLSTIPQLSDAS
ncbi:MAG: hypothetical protein BBJ57_10185 [Desulfobacterales bacterium PC51MH44]|nr:MAG: hypothetical protein BBJ57_10185 [Desulfobacterales bacterium PC51MH44]